MPRAISQQMRLRNVRLIVCDVDGVLTDGRILMDAGGQEIKQFSVLDGTGFALARRAGLKTAVLSARTSLAVAYRARECRIDWVMQGEHEKLAALTRLCQQQKIPLENVAYLGDDLIDLPVMAAVGLAVAVANAVPEVKRRAHWITRARGGQGALREVVERILRSQSRWTAVLAEYTRPRTEAVSPSSPELRRHAKN